MACASRTTSSIAVGSPITCRQITVQHFAPYTGQATTRLRLDGFGVSSIVSDVATTQSPHAKDLTLGIFVEVSGCPTTCMHCWALGGNHGTMPLDDAACVLEALERFCGERKLRYTAYPMHEVTAHPAAPDIIRLPAPPLHGVL